MKKFLFLLSAILMIGTSATAGVVKTYDDAGTPMSFSDFLDLSGTGKHFGLMAVSENSDTYKKWFGFTSATSRVYDLTKAQLFTLSGTTDNYTVTRVSDNTAAQSGLKLVNRAGGDYAPEYTPAMSISFDNASGSHFNANSYAFAGGTDGWSAYVAYGPFYVATIEIQDVDGNVLQAATEQIVTEGYIPTVANRTYVSGGSVNADGTYTFVFSKEDEAAKRQDELNALIATVEAAYAANNVGQPGANLITATTQFSSNATESSEGSLSNLLDGNLNSYWHSQWSAGNQPMHTHYLQVALTEAIDGTIQMTMGRRNGAANDHPVKMSVEYSVDGSEPYTLLDGQFMEFSATTGYVTGTFNLATAAKYLRFFNDDSNGSNDRGYWHCSEFQLNKMGASLNETYPTDAANMLAALNAAKAITSGATQANIDALQTAFNAYKNAAAPTYNVTINGATDGKVIYNSTQYGNGESFKAADLAATDLTALALDGYYPAAINVSGHNVTVTYTVFPFQYADSKENIQHWYALNIHHNNKHYVYYSADATPNVQANVTTYQTAPEYAWGFVGNPTDGFVIYNKASDTALYSADNNTSCTVGATASTFKATLTGWTAAQADGGFCLNVEGQQYVNYQGDQLKHWGDNDSGSTFHAIELDMSVDAAYKAAKTAAMAALTGAATMPIYDATAITTATNAINAITYNATDETSINNAIATLNGYMETFYASANGKKFALVSKNDWSTRGVTRYLTTANTTTDRLIGTEDVELFSVFTATYDAAHKGYTVAMAYTPTIYLPVTGNASSAITPSETPGYYTFVGGATAGKPAIISCISSTVSSSQGGIHLDGGKNIVVWGPDGAASQWAFELVSDTDYEALVEAYESAQKTYAYVITDAEGNDYEGTYTSEEENARPVIAGIEGLTFTDEKWEDVSEYRDDVDYVYTANFDFPFPVNTPTLIYAFQNDNFQWQAAGSDITVQKDVTGNGEEFRWTIVPAYDEEKGAFSFTINNNAGSYITTSATAKSHDQGTVTFGTIGTPLVWASGAFKLANQGLYLSVNSSNTANLQYLGVWDSAHNGTKLKFVEYVPTTTIDITIGTTGYATIAYTETFVNKPEGLKVYYCTEGATPASLNTVEWDKDYIPGYCAYILEGTPGTYTLDCVDTDTFDIPDEDYDAVADIFYNGLLYGNFDNTDITVEDAQADYGENIYVFSKKNEVLGFYQFAGATLAAHKAFYATEEASIQGFTLDFGGQAVGVNSVISAANLKAGYDIQGRRINKLQKGINVINGKKIIK